jgi:hypothetical protein
VHTPEPVQNPAAFAAATQFITKIPSQVRVLLYGEGPDNALRYEWRPYLTHLLARRRAGPLIRAVSEDLLMHPRVPLWSLMREVAGARGRERRWRQVFPGWLNEEFAARSACRERWDAHYRPSGSRHR